MRWPKKERKEVDPFSFRPSVLFSFLHLDSPNSYMDNRNDKNHGEEQKDNQTDKEKSLKFESHWISGGLF